jgi:tetrahydromethanopterin S-methyltransferase subunit G
MKILFPFLVLLASCSTVHKLSHTMKKNTDSAATLTKDSSYKSSTNTQTSNLDVKDVDVTVYYNDSVPTSTEADIALAKAIAQPVDRSPRDNSTGGKLAGYADLIRDAISHNGHPGNISAIQIHIGSISDSSTRTQTADTGATHAQSDVHVKTEEKQVDKKVDRTGLSIGAKIGIGFALLIGLIVFLLYLAKKLHLI